MSITEEVVDVVIHCGEDHPSVPNVRCGREADHEPPCCAIEPRTGRLERWVPDAGAAGTLGRIRGVLAPGQDHSDEQLVATVARLAYLEDRIYRLLADLAAPVPADTSPVDHLARVLRGHVDQAAELIRTRQALSGAVDKLRIVRSHVDNEFEAALADAAWASKGEEVSDVKVTVDGEDVTVQVRGTGAQTAPLLDQLAAPEPGIGVL
jgi:hypothetical protein